MSSLQHLRENRPIVRWMLVWFCMAMGVAIATPAIQPQVLSLVCTTSGPMKLVSSADTDESAPLATGHTLDCVMCLPTSVPSETDVSVAVPQAPRQRYGSAVLTPPIWRLVARARARDSPLFS